MRKGFTLVELLIVIAIIGILVAALLVSLGSARRSARDARRGADLRNVQNALELYYSNNTAYPATVTWTGLNSLETALQSVGIAKIPLDPINSTPYLYKYCPANPAQSYVLKAGLEGRVDTLLDGDLDAFPTGFTATAGCFVATECADGTTAPFGYCVSL